VVQMSDYPEGRVHAVEHKGTSAFLEFAEGKPFLHLSLDGWSHSLYKEYLDVLSEVLEFLRGKGFSEVYVAIPKDEKLLRFEQMFGFDIIAETPEGYLLAQET